MTDWTAADLPSFAGRTVIVTGANSGLGAVTARELARSGATGRSWPSAPRARARPPRGRSTGDVEVRQLDLQDLSSVRAVRRRGRTRSTSWSTTPASWPCPYAVTVDGFESQIGTNHLGHFALTNLLLPKLTDRVVTVSSMLHWPGRIDLDDLNWKYRRYSAWLAYGQSKLANLLFTSELQRRLAAAGSSLRALAAHPGYSHTNLQGHSGRKLSDALMPAATRWWPPTPTSAPARRCTRRRRTCRATRSSAPDSARRPHPAGRTQPAARRMRRPRQRCGTCPSSSPAPNFRSEVLMR